MVDHQDITDISSIVQQFQQLSQQQKLALSILMQIQKDPQSVTVKPKQQNLFPTPKPKQKQTMNFKLYCQTVKPLKQHSKNLLNLSPTPRSINPMSKKIIQKKQKQGKKYIPIHMRTSDELRKKFDHLNELRNQIKNKQERKYLQCTFTPTIIKTDKTVNRNPNDFVNNLYSKNRTNKRNKREGQQTLNLDCSSFDERLNKSLQFSYERNQSKQRLQQPSFIKNNVYKNSNKNIELVNKRPNKKFNILLDIIK